MGDLVPGLVAVVALGDCGGIEWIRMLVVDGWDFEVVCCRYHSWVELVGVMMVVVSLSVTRLVMLLLNPYLLIAGVPGSIFVADSGAT